MNLQIVSPSELQGVEGAWSWGKVIESASKGSLIGSAIGFALGGAGGAGFGAIVGASAGATVEILSSGSGEGHIEESHVPTE